MTAPAQPAPVAPDRGDIVYLEFEPQAGREQAGRRPALVLSPRAYSAASGLMLCCPITSKVKNYPFEVKVIGTTKVAGMVLSDQVRSLDWQARNAQAAGRAADDVLEEIAAKQRVLLG